MWPLPSTIIPADHTLDAKCIERRFRDVSLHLTCEDPELSQVTVRHGYRNEFSSWTRHKCRALGVRDYHEVLVRDPLPRACAQETVFGNGPNPMKVDTSLPEDSHLPSRMCSIDKHLAVGAD